MSRFYFNLAKASSTRIDKMSKARVDYLSKPEDGKYDLTETSTTVLIETVNKSQFLHTVFYIFTLNIFRKSISETGLLAII